MRNKEKKNDVTLRSRCSFLCLLVSLSRRLSNVVGRGSPHVNTHINTHIQEYEHTQTELSEIRGTTVSWLGSELSSPCRGQAALGHRANHAGGSFYPEMLLIARTFQASPTTTTTTTTMWIELELLKV
ncbi:hypothetical protein M0802_015258 [Mischocyttarus mexicanus]|nr:hypothetical protein M0802_015691 [Mischocyttarus mexicanus]KAI4475171.1 hypothetical protein M0802_015258 [Mischocyttarus mexicanus]